MNLPEILQSLRSNGYNGVAKVLEDKTEPHFEGMYADFISDNMYELDPEPLSSEYIVLSPEFAMLRSVATIMASYTPIIEIDLEADVIEGTLITEFEQL